jgi:alpha-galactosidase
MDRRAFLLAPALAAAQSALPPAQPTGAKNAAPVALPEVARVPDAVAVLRGGERLALAPASTEWKARDVVVTTAPRPEGELAIRVAAPGGAIDWIGLRWKGAFLAGYRFLGDHWERSYGDLEWRCAVPYRRLPWYFLASDGHALAGYGVKTGASAIACWQVDSAGVTLWLDVRSGGVGVELGSRQLEAATVVTYRAPAGESPWITARAFCQRMCAKPRVPAQPVYGGNNWYYTYGNNLTADALLRDSDMMADLAGGETNRPWMVLDMGYEAAGEGAGPVARTTAGFHDMSALPAEMKKRGVRPGIWVRLLLTTDKLPEPLRLKGKQAAGGLGAPYFVLDPSVPDSLAYVEREIATLRGWGFEMIKHDFSTYDMFGRWGFEMPEDLSGSQCRFADRSRTTAEIVTAFYTAIRHAAGDALLIGCNTVGHLGAGLFELQRIGDDTSGREWPRTRKMGINTLAFRLPQHGTFFAADADCVPVTAAIPPRLTEDWLDLVSRSGTPLFVSADPAVMGATERGAIRAAFARSARTQAPGLEPLDWMETTSPQHWRAADRTLVYDWYDAEV